LAEGSSFNCDRPLRSGVKAPETVLSTDGQITDSERSYTVTHPIGHRIAPEPVTYTSIFCVF